MLQTAVRGTRGTLQPVAEPILKIIMQKEYLVQEITISLNDKHPKSE